MELEINLKFPDLKRLWNRPDFSRVLQGSKILNFLLMSPGLPDFLDSLFSWRTSTKINLVIRSSKYSIA